MFKNPQDVLDFIQREGVVNVDFKTVDLFGRWHHLTFPARHTDGAPFVEGFGFDGSSYGFQKVDRSDMIMLPDLSTGTLDPFYQTKTLSFITNIHLTDEAESRYQSDPRFIAEKAEGYLQSLGIGDRLLLGPEFEFYVFDSAAFSYQPQESFFCIDAQQAAWNTGTGANCSYHVPDKAGYHAALPGDTLADFRSDLCEILDDMGVSVKYHHHEVGGVGQQEIEVGFSEPRLMADKTMTLKYAAKNFARAQGKTLTFMPKPLFGHPGNGMHIHFKLFKGDVPVFSQEDGYAGLSRTALSFIAGILKHSPALLAFTNPSTNSYKRLIPGYEAPVSIAFATANRSAAIRVPGYVKTAFDRRFEFRTPDATCNPYLAYAAIAMAGLDGVRNNLDPTELGFGPVDRNIFDLPPEERAKIHALPTSLEEALCALEQDHDFLMVDGVFPEALIQTWIRRKREEEVRAVQVRPHPMEYILYYDL